MLETRSLEQHDSLCPAAYALGETPAGSGVLCRVTGRVVATATDPSSLAAYCWCSVSSATGPGPSGSKVGIGYQQCPVWLHNRKRELDEKQEWAKGTPSKVKTAMEPGFVTKA